MRGEITPIDRVKARLLLRAQQKQPIHYTLGVDLGQANDPTAFSVIEQVSELDAYSWERKYNLVHLERVPLGTSYPKVVELTQKRIDHLKGLAGEGGLVQLAVDATGVGRPVVDLLVQAELAPMPVIITGGDQATYSDGYWRVPKRDLIGMLQVLLQDKRLRVAPGMPEGKTFVHELQNFKYKISVAGHDSYEAWREGDHDDLVLSVAIACWAASRGAEENYA